MKLLTAGLLFIATILVSAFAYQQLAFAQGTGTIVQLQQFVSTTSPSSAITQATYGKLLKITGLATGLCLTLDANNLLTTTSCGGGGAGSGTVSTSTPLVSGQVDFSTGVSTIGNDSSFLFDTATKKHTFTFGSTTALSATTLCLGTDCRQTWPAGGGGSGTGSVSTSSLETSGFLAYWNTTSGYPAKLDKVATSSLGVTGPITFSGTLGAQVGGSGGSFGCATCLTANQSITLSGAVTGSGATAITTTFGSLGAGVLGTPVTGVPTPQATSTLYGVGTGGFVLGYSGGQLVPLATSSIQNITLTTTGSSGAATLIGTTLNIPQYAASAGGLGTTSPWTAGQLAYVVNNATVSSAATTSLTATSPLALSQPISVIGSSASALTIDTTGTWSGNAVTASALLANGANCGTGYFPLGVSAAGVAENCTQAVGTSTSNTWGGTQTFTNNPVLGSLAGVIYGNSGILSAVATSSFSTSGPWSIAGTLGAFVGGVNSTLTYWGLSTTSNPTAGQLLMSNGGAGVSSAATTSVTCTGNTTCNPFTVLGSSPITINSTGGAGSAGGTWSTTTSSVAGQLINYTNNNTDIVTIGGNSTTSAKMYFDPNAALGYAFGTSSPWGYYSIGSHNLSPTKPAFLIASSSTGVATTTQLILTNGNLGIATSSPGSLFSINGVANFSTGTSSLYGNGINLAGGCFAINGVCIGAGGSAVSSSDPFTHASVWNQTTSATSTLLALTGAPFSLVASSTAVFTQASTTQLSITGQSAASGNNCLQIDTLGYITKTGSACGGAGSTPGGADTQLQYNDGSTFNGAALLTYLKSGLFFGIGSTSPQFGLSIGSTTGVVAEEYIFGRGFGAAATSTSMSIGIASSSVQHIDYATSAMTLTVSGFKATPGASTRVFTCGPATGTGGAITWAGGAGIAIKYSGGVAPTNTTQVASCDEWFLDVDIGPQASSTPWVWITQAPGAF